MEKPPELIKKSSFKRKVLDGFESYNSKVSWSVFILISIFSMGGWIEVFGIWSELPLMVNSLPEGWRLPGILTGFTQIGQIGSIIYLIARHFFPKHISFKRFIFIKLIVTTTFTLLLSFYWNKTFFLFGEQRSIGLLVLILIFSLCDGFSTLSTIPYISQSFKKEYIIPYYIGEALFALIPSVIAIFQGVGDDLGCQDIIIVSNITNNNSILYFNQTIKETIPLNPIFSVSTYFQIIFGFLLMSTIAFILLNTLNLVKKEHKENNYQDDKSDKNEQENSLLMTLNQKIEEEKLIKSNNQNEKNLLFVLNFLNTFCSYGILAGLQSYSTLPYGNQVFHLSINLTNLFLPIAVFLSVWSYNVSIKRIIIENFLAIIFFSYIVICSIMSPCPPLLNNIFGSILIIICWILSISLFMRVRCVISTRLERFGEDTLMVSGAFTLLGEVFGGIFIYILVEKLRLFTEKPECIFDFSYCSNV